MTRSSATCGLALVLATAGLGACTGVVDGGDEGQGGPAMPASRKPAGAGPHGASAEMGSPVGSGVSGSLGTMSGLMPGGSTKPADPAAPPPPGSSPAAPSACKAVDRPGPRVLRRLTASELNESLKDVFGSSRTPLANVLNDPEVLGFRSDASRLVVQDLVGQQLLDHAADAARWAVGDRLPLLSPCMTNDSACRQQFIKKFGRKALRQPLTDAQVTAYEGLMAGEATFADGVEAVVTALLASPYFLYRNELGKPDPANPGRFVLTQHEVASELSYLLLGSMPDSMLSAAADAGMLATTAQIDAQVDRLLKDPRSAEAVMHFVSGWLGLEHLYTNVKDDTVFKLTDALKKDMMAETKAFVTDTFSRGGTLSELLTAPYTFANKGLTQYYGLSGGGDQIAKVVLPAGQRDPGILAHASLLTGHAAAATSSPVRRGKLVRTRLLCQELPEPPGDIDTMLKPAKGTVTTRDRFAQHRENPSCAGCHQFMDPIGNGFERYDAFGRRRDTDNGLPVDSKAAIIGAPGGDFNFDGLKDLSGYLAKSDEVKSCLVRYWSYFAYGQSSWQEDACTFESIKAEAQKGGFTLRSVVMGIVHAPHFTRRVQDL